MAIRIQHGPIGAAAKLAGEAGKAKAFDRALALRRQVAQEQATGLQGALSMQQLRQKDRLAAQERALQQQQLAAEQQHQQSRLGLQSRELNQQQQQFAASLPLKRERAAAYRQSIEQQGRGRRPKPVTDVRKLPAWNKAEAAKRARQDRIDAMERQYRNSTRENALGRRVPKEGVSPEKVQQLQQQMSELGGEVGAISQEQMKLADEFEIGGQIDDELGGIASQESQMDDEFESQVRAIESQFSEDDNPSVPKIMDVVIGKYGTPDTEEEAQELADIINAVERRIRGR